MEKIRDIVKNFQEAAIGLQNKKRVFLHISPEQFKSDLLEFGGYYVRRENPEGEFKIDESNKEIVKQLFYYITGSDKFAGQHHKGIFLSGAFGCGKTTILRALGSIYTAYTNQAFEFKTTFQLIDLVIEGDVNLRRKNLIIDELGRESIVVKDFGTERTPIAELLTDRYNSQSLTFATSNFKIERLGTDEFYGEYIGDRMKQMFNYFELPGKSRRK